MEVFYMEQYFKPIFVWCSAILSHLTGGSTVLLQTLIIFVALDYVTGLLASAVNGKLSSRVGRRGIAKKVLVFSMVATAHLLDTLIGNGHLMRDGTIVFYLCNEAISILENSGRVGLPIPTKMRQAIEILKQTKGDKYGD